jgi:hypothetical protein
MKWDLTEDEAGAIGSARIYADDDQYLTRPLLEISRFRPSKRGQPCTWRISNPRQTLNPYLPLPEMTDVLEVRMAAERVLRKEGVA